ncbi:undecaprenyl-diphosphate phosphatase [Mariniflexile litorale]|uniref:Undecaprenyl-diphosphatase n=1 Tax=Mariniflexile litorale TaxID=3045158 RepID=A0AAU7EIF6_9FLAO|nr:undecaprenyl-diphosphate phosphatase [Mariniflexile sp. KMM 9835]MDQ8209915.1 undecaprenyl-diphosphate phosphatase [Mariniflexile sp. KMM 9835]
MDIIQAIILAIIEGVTEFLPISSTGHMILASSLMKIESIAFVTTFEIFIQLGAILAIVLIYSKRLLQGVAIYRKLVVAFLPTAIIGFLLYNFIKTYLFNPTIVAVSLIIGGIILILIDKKVINQKSKTAILENISYKNAFIIGLTQCFSMIPGVSRAAATIVGGVLNGLDKKQATEFSFLLAIPTMFAASTYDLLKTPLEISNKEIFFLSLGLFISFGTAWIAVNIFLKIVEKYGFEYFGYYRIIIGLLFLLILK